MSAKDEYQVMARSLRPQQFKEVIGQEPVKTTLKNAYSLNRLGHAYLFSGPHGTGKTTLARIFAKILNCENPSDNEPCNLCSSCSEIARSSSLDVIEIDGASNRGIDDIRQINESVGFSAGSNRYKIYLIDEVHMLTKEAFNALLKTLEEPPKKVKFFFATTEPHKVPSTILSRCQCFYLQPINTTQIADHLTQCCQLQEIKIDPKASHLIAQRSNGSLRDALVLTDQIISFCKESVDYDSVTHFLGLLNQSSLFAFDQKAKANQVEGALELAREVFESGKNLHHFLDTLCEHYRQILYLKVFKSNTKLLPIAQEDLENYQNSANCYEYEQCIYIIDLILEAQAKLKLALSKQIALENLLVQIVRSFQRVSVKNILEKLNALEVPTNSAKPAITQIKEPLKAPLKKSEPVVKQEIKKEPIPKPIEKLNSKKDLPKPVPIQENSTNFDEKKQKSRYDTIMQFAAVELEGSINKEVK